MNRRRTGAQQHRADDQRERQPSKGPCSSLGFSRHCRFSHIAFAAFAAKTPTYYMYNVETPSKVATAVAGSIRPTSPQPRQLLASLSVEYRTTLDSWKQTMQPMEAAPIDGYIA